MVCETPHSCAFLSRKLAYETGNLIFRDWEDNYKRNDSTKLFTDTSIMGEKLMEDKETKLREVIRGLVKEMLVTVKENIDDEKDDAAEEEARAAEEEAEKAGGQVGAVYKGVTEDDVQNEMMNPNDCYDRCEEDYGDDVETRLKCEKECDYLRESIQNESTFFPQTHDIREKARQRTHEALMNRWGYNQKGNK